MAAKKVKISFVNGAKKKVAYTQNCKNDKEVKDIKEYLNHQNIKGKIGEFSVQPVKQNFASKTALKLKHKKLEVARVSTRFRDKLKKRTIKKAKAEKGVKLPSVVRNGLYYHFYGPDRLCLVIATGKQIRPTCFTAKCVFDGSSFKQVGITADNWDIRTFTFIPSLSEILAHIGELEFKPSPSLVKPGTVFITTNCTFLPEAAKKIIKAITI